MELFSRISVTCFAASYAIGMLLELLRLFSSQRWLRWGATIATGAGILAQALFLLARGVSESRLPIATRFESLITISWLVSLVYLYLFLRDRRIAFGIFTLPVTLGLILYAQTVTDKRARFTDDAKPVLAASHGLLLLAGTVVVVVAMLAAVMYLLKFRQLKHGGTLGSIRLPSLERLERLNTIAIFVAWPLLTLGIGLGFLLQQIRWTDPKVLATMLSWLFLTVLVHYRYHPENRGRRVALLTLLAGVSVLLSLLGDPIFATEHQHQTWTGAGS